MAVKAIYSDINEKFVKSGQGDIKLSLNAEAVKTSLTNIILTRKGSRTMLPDFGAALDNFLFENFSNASANQMAQRIKNEVLKWDDRINLVNIQFKPSFEEQSIDMTVVFSVKGDDTLMNLTVPLV